MGVQGDVSCDNGIATLHYRTAGVYGENIFVCNCKKITNSTLMSTLLHI
jgi:hypothetical protein